MSTFVPGLTLCEAFYHEAAKPILERLFPSIPYSAALIGWGSEVLGYDDPQSTDHHWGPRFLLFLSERDREPFGPSISEALANHLPHHFRGYPTGFAAADAAGVRLPEEAEAGPVHHMIRIDTVRSFFLWYLGCDPRQDLRPVDWLVLEEHKLLAVTRGRVFHDGLNQLEPARQRLAYYPRDLWLYLLASEWQKISQAEHLMGRAGYAGDELGSQLVAARLAHSLMRLGFLMHKRYAPYSKWFGKAFAELEIAERLGPILRRVLTSAEWQAREEHLSQAYEIVAHAHNALGITPPQETRVSPFHTRPYQVIHADAFVSAILAVIADPAVKALGRPIGSVNQFLDSTDILSHTPRCNKLKILWEA